MSIAQALLGELNFELMSARKALERVPEAQFDYKPHERSSTLLALASHIATIGYWGTATCTGNEVDLNSPLHQARPEPPKTVAELVERFDKNYAEFRAALANVTDAQMMEPWSLKMGEQTIFTQPRIGVLRGFVISHMIHHRGQLSVYLRMLNVPVPSMYGPSADESNF